MRVLALLILLVIPATARATIVAAPPVTIATGEGGWPDVQLERSGGALAAWSTSEAVYAARQTAAGAWLPPLEVASGVRYASVSLVRAPLGPRGLIWAQMRVPGEEAAPVRLALTDAHGDLGPVEAVPGTAGAGFSDGDAAQLPDGTTAVIFRRYASNDSSETIFAVERRPDGSWSAPRQLGDGVSRVAAVTPAGDRLVVLWSGVTQDDPPGTLSRLRSAERAPDGTWSDAVAFTDPGSHADNGASVPQLVADDRGDLLAAWNPASPSSPLFGEGIAVAQHPAGGAWSATAIIDDGFRPTAAMSPNGTSAVVWTGAPLSYVLRHADGRLEAGPDPTVLQTAIEQSPTAVDDAGHVAVLGRGDFMNRQGRLDLYVRDPGGCFQRHAVLTPLGTAANGGRVLLRGDGSGLVTWSQPDGTIHAATLTDLPDPVALPCPAPAGAPADAPALWVYALPKTITRRRLARNGVRIAIRTTTATRVRVTLTAARRIVGRAQLSPVNGDRVLRVRGRHVGRRVRRLVVTVGGAADGGLSVRRRTVRLTPG